MTAEKCLERAAWIWCDHSEEPNQYACFLQDFTAADGGATLYIAADSGYAAFVNGQYVPGFAFSDYPDLRSVDTLDITGYVHPGVNRLCVIGYCQVTSSLVYRQGHPAVRFAVYAGEEPLALSGAETLSRRAPEYTSGPVENITSQLSYSFHYDATRYDGWTDEAYIPDGSWKAAVPSLTDAALRARPIPTLTLEPPHPAGVLTYGTFTDAPQGQDMPVGQRMQSAALTFGGRVSHDDGPCRLPDADGILLEDAAGDGLYVILDLGEETAGLLTLDMELPHRAAVLIGFGEHLDDLRVRTDVGGRQFAAVYHAAAGRQTFTHYFKRLGARYLQLHIYAPSVRLYYAGLRPVLYPVPFVREPRCGDMLMDRIYRTAVRTLRLCMHEHYEDCPWREQGLYAMDSRIQMLCGYYAFGETAMPRESLRLLARGQWENGLLEMCAPSTFDMTIPSFSLAFIGNVRDYVDHTGDAAFAAEMLPVVARILQAFLPQITAEGLLADFVGDAYWNFYEWTDGMTGWWQGRSPAGRYAPMQAMYLLAAEQYLSLCAEVGQPPFSPELPAMLDRLRKAAGAFWNEERQAFCTCLDAAMPDNELVQALMLCAGVPDARQRDILLEKLTHPGENGLLPVTLSYSIFKYDALMSEPERYADFVRRDVAAIWGEMLFKGATSFWETQRGAWDFENAGSLCHGWAAVPIYLYHRYAEYLIK